MSKRPAGKPGRAARAPASRSPAKAAERRHRARSIRWAAAGAAAVAAAAVITVFAVAGGRAGGTAGGPSSAAGANPPAAGTLAPAGSFTTVAGSARTVSSLRGQPVLVWLVTTWCPGCQAGTRALPADLVRLSAHRIRVVELEDYADLGQPGPGMAAFGPQFAGAAYRSPDWVFGTASEALTQAYNPRGYLDIYYLIDSAGRVVYVNSGPAATMEQLLARAGGLR